MLKTIIRVAIPALAAAALFGYAGAASAQISGTLHNLSAVGASDNDEICVYCHTPHAANTGVTAPLWNKATASLAFTTYTSSTIDGTLATGGVGGVSLACLTCHEGTQAVDSFINAPGSGFGATTGDTNTSIAARAAASSLSNPLTNIGNDLTNDHPISIQYANYASTVTDGDFNAATAATGASTTGPWWVDTGTTGTGTREKSDMILYTRDFGGTARPAVECASCHDPHEDVNPTFLRVSNTGSAVCLACHDK